jgi:uncharacterized protein YbjT (DUF2867 family)
MTNDTRSSTLTRSLPVLVLLALAETAVAQDLVSPAFPPDAPVGAGIAIPCTAPGLVTPPDMAETIARQLGRSRHVVVPNEGHGVGGECIEGLMTQLVVTGSVDRLDPSCVTAAPPTRFRLR